MADPLDQIKPPAQVLPPGAAADPLDGKEYELLKQERLKAELESLKVDTEARKTYAERIYRLAVAWLTAVLLVVLLQGFQFWFWTPLPENVVIALVVGSTTGVLGILASVIAYIFRVPRS
jgi:hypothetical protein